MSLKHAILSLLVESKKTGYDLNRNFEGSIGYYWSASHQQIYKTLNDMLNDGWVSVELTEQASKPDKKLYSLTEDGEEVLRQWALEPVKRSPIKNQLLIKLLLAKLVGAAPILVQLRAQLTRVNNLIRDYEHIKEQYFTPEPVASTHIKNTTSYLTLRNGILHAEAERDWLLEAIATLENYA